MSYLFVYGTYICDGDEPVSTATRQIKGVEPTKFMTNEVRTLIREEIFPPDRNDLSSHHIALCVDQSECGVRLVGIVAQVREYLRLLPGLNYRFDKKGVFVHIYLLYHHSFSILSEYRQHLSIISAVCKRSYEELPHLSETKALILVEEMRRSCLSILRHYEFV